MQDCRSHIYLFLCKKIQICIQTNNLTENRKIPLTNVSYFFMRKRTSSVLSRLAAQSVHACVCTSQNIWNQFLKELQIYRIAIVFPWKTISKAPLRCALACFLINSKKKTHRIILLNWCFIFQLLTGRGGWLETNFTAPKVKYQKFRKPFWSFLNFHQQRRVSIFETLCCCYCHLPCIGKVMMSASDHIRVPIGIVRKHQRLYLHNFRLINLDLQQLCFKKVTPTAYMISHNSLVLLFSNIHQLKNVRRDCSSETIRFSPDGASASLRSAVTF